MKKWELWSQLKPPESTKWKATSINLLSSSSKLSQDKANSTLHYFSADQESWSRKSVQKFSTRSRTPLLTQRLPNTNSSITRVRKIEITGWKCPMDLWKNSTASMSYSFCLSIPSLPPLHPPSQSTRSSQKINTSTLLSTWLWSKKPATSQSPTTQTSSSPW